MTQIPTNTAAGLAALQTAAGLYSLDASAWIEVTGADRLRWLNGMLTNGIQQLAAGEGNYNFILSAQGRIQGDAYAFAQSDSVLLQTGASQLATLMQLLDRFIIMDDVELHDRTAAYTGIGIAGPQAEAVLGRAAFDLVGLEPIHLRTATWNGTNVNLIAAYSPLIPRYELWAAPEHANALRAALLSTGAVECNAECVEALRILEGTPLFGTDIRERDLPQETAQTRALHFTKGCYIGQEIVERIRSRGNVHRTFSGFLLSGNPPAPGTTLEADGKPVGELTSCVDLQTEIVALGYIRREAIDKNLALTFAGGTATPVTLPFAPVRR